MLWLSNQDPPFQSVNTRLCEGSSGCHPPQAQSHTLEDNTCNPEAASVGRVLGALWNRLVLCDVLNQTTPQTRYRLRPVSWRGNPSSLSMPSTALGSRLSSLAARGVEISGRDAMSRIKSGGCEV